MITVIAYGRNDAHGYNMHRRAALGLNCLAEVLTEPEDEIVFVDYNTPDALPTLIEALADTLTDRCLERLRVLRVRAATHERCFAGRTHLPAIEPVARNAAARRANPSNRWLLSTNTDMILLSLSDSSISEICKHLPDGFYGLPRFELPEWVWEHLPRSDPSRAMREIASLGPALRLDESTLNHEWIRFDAPGDFQLILRDDFVAIDGFDEEMLLGWHVDSNLSRRMFLHRGEIRSLEDRVAGYHCNHNRTPTVLRGPTWIANDMDRFFFSVDRADLPRQRETWGLADLQLEEVPPLGRARATFVDALTAATDRAPAPRTPSDVRTAEFGLTYDSRHVSAFVADSMMVTQPGATIGYVGANPVLRRMLEVAVESLDLGISFLAAKLDHRDFVEDLARAADLFVIDLGVDVSLVEDESLAHGGHRTRAVPESLQLAFEALRHLVDLERARLEAGHHPRRFVLVNSAAAYWNAYVLAELECSHTTVHSRVRCATVKANPDETVARKALQSVRRYVRWEERDPSGEARLRLVVGEPVAVAELERFDGFGEGWAHPDRSAIWTRGPRAELAVELAGVAKESCVLTLGFDGIGVRAEAPLRVNLLINGAPVATREFTRIASHSRQHDRNVIRDTPRLSLGRLADSVRTRVRTLAMAKKRAPNRVAKALASYAVELGAHLGRNLRPRSAPRSTPEYLWHVALPQSAVEARNVDVALVMAPISWLDDRQLGLHLALLAVRRSATGYRLWSASFSEDRSE